MTYEYKDNGLCFHGLNLSQVAEEFGTPCYVYSQRAIEKNFTEYKKAFGDREHLICYAVKANSNLSILKVLKEMGAGFDIVSAGELERVKLVEGSCRDTVYSGVGKTESEIQSAIESDIGCINVESRDELEMILGAAANLGCSVPMAVRVNPNVNPNTHPYISTGLKENKFGVPMEEALNLYQIANDSKFLKPVGIACHIGSQLTDSKPLVEAARDIVSLAEELRNAEIILKDIDVGGGLGIKYSQESLPTIAKWVSEIKSCVPEIYRIKVEPGRSIVGAAGVLLTRVQCLKDNEERSFAISDAAMNDLLRPALYNTEHKVLPCILNSQLNARSFDLVGPICETGDWLAKSQEFAVEKGDILAIRDVGAYGFSMSSNYNSRPRAAEVLVGSDGTARLVRSRESIADMVSLETAYLS